MGVYIKGMEKPKCCLDCWTMHLHAVIGCEIIGEPNEIAPNCPLVEVKEPHGRLIDADVLCERLMTEWHTADENGKKIISEVMADVVTPIVVGTPTVIEAEGSE
jgi:hypothetical protein